MLVKSSSSKIQRVKFCWTGTLFCLRGQFGNFVLRKFQFYGQFVSLNRGNSCNIYKWILSFSPFHLSHPTCRFPLHNHLRSRRLGYPAATDTFGLNLTSLNYHAASTLKITIPHYILELNISSYVSHRDVSFGFHVVGII